MPKYYTLATSNRINNAGTGAVHRIFQKPDRSESNGSSRRNCPQQLKMIVGSSKSECRMTELFEPSKAPE